MMRGFRGIGWVKDKSDSGKMLAEFLPFAYNKDEYGHNSRDKRPEAIELGQFLD
jgi:hypothetical protein